MIFCSNTFAVICRINGIDFINILQFWLLKTGFAHKLRNEVIFYPFYLQFSVERIFKFMCCCWYFFFVSFCRLVICVYYVVFIFVFFLPQFYHWKCLPTLHICICLPQLWAIANKNDISIFPSNTEMTFFCC